MTKKLFLVDTLSTFRIRYAIEAESEREAEALVLDNSSNDYLKEFSQKHLGMTLISAHEMNESAYLNIFNQDNDYLESWSDEEKMIYINRIEDHE